MKKYILVIATVLLASSGAYAVINDGSYGAASDGLAIGSDTNGQTTVKASKGVQIGYKADTTSGLGYILASYHESGTQTFATSSGDTKIFKQDTTGVVITGMTVPTGSDTADFTGWTAM